MNKELADELNKKLGALTFVEKQAGLVQVVEYHARVPGKDEGAADSTKLERFPMSTDIDYAECKLKRKERDLIPNSNLKGISYFEDGGISPLAKTRNGMEYESRLRFVCWMNRKLLTGNDYSHIVTQTMGYIIATLTERPFNAGPFTRCLVTVKGIPITNKSIFSAYTYDEAVTQYLMPPYEYFAIDFGIKFSVPNECFNTLILTPRTC